MSELERTHRIVFRYSDEKGRTVEEANPTGTLGNIAGISNEQGNVVGMMPHPERGCDPILSPSHSVDGLLIFESMVEASR